MENGGVRKRREGTRELSGQHKIENTISNNDESIDNNRWNPNDSKYNNGKNKNFSNNVNESLNKYMNSFANNFSFPSKNKTEKGINTWRKDDKKKAVNIFNSSNISTISSTCKKSFADIITNINNNMKNFSENIPNNTNISAKFGESQHNKSINFNNKTYGISNHSSIEKRTYDVTSPSTNNNTTFANERNRSLQRNVLEYTNNKKKCIDINVKRSVSFEKNAKQNNGMSKITSSNLENYLNKNAYSNNSKYGETNEKYKQPYDINIELNSIKTINDDETYFICLDNLLRNHGNIDSNEMLKYNEKSINFLNDIIFLDVYRAYNVMTYMQNKVNIIILTIKFIRRKLKRKHVPEEVVISLEFLSFCIKNIGIFFVRHIDEKFMKRLSKLLRSTTLKKSITKNVKMKLSKFLIVPVVHPGVATDPRLHFIKRKILFLLQLWHDAFINQKSLVIPIYEEYRSLKEKGITFPVIDKSEKFFVNHSGKSFGNRDIFADLPLNPCQIENLVKSVKEISNMNAGEEKSKCVFIISKYKEKVIECINKLSDYKGNVNVEPTMNALLYVNDEIENLHMLDKHQQIDEENENIKKEKDTQFVDDAEGKKLQKKKKKKNKEEVKKLSEIILKNSDPWSTPQTNHNEEVQLIDNLFSVKSEEDLFSKENISAFSTNESNSEKKKELINIVSTEYVDKYDVFNEIKFMDTNKMDVPQAIYSFDSTNVGAKYLEKNEKANNLVKCNAEIGPKDKEMKESDFELNTFAKGDMNFEPTASVPVQTNSIYVDWKPEKENNLDLLNDIFMNNNEMTLKNEQGNEYTVYNGLKIENEFNNFSFPEEIKMNNKESISNKIFIDEPIEKNEELFFNNVLSKELDKEIYKESGLEMNKETKGNLMNSFSKNPIYDAHKYSNQANFDNSFEEFDFENKCHNSIYNDEKREHIPFPDETQKDVDPFLKDVYKDFNNVHIKESSNLSEINRNIQVDKEKGNDETCAYVSYREDTMKNFSDIKGKKDVTNKSNIKNMEDVKDMKDEIWKDASDKKKKLQDLEMNKIKIEKAENEWSTAIINVKEIQHDNEVKKEKQESHVSITSKAVIDNNKNNNTESERVQEKDNANMLISECEKNIYSRSLKSDSFDDSVLNKVQSNASAVIECKKTLERKSDAANSSDVYDSNIDEFDEINKALDDLNSNFENLSGYKYDQ